MLQVRKLVGLGALLVSYLDGLDNYGALYWGDKRNLAMVRAVITFTDDCLVIGPIISHQPLVDKQAVHQVLADGLASLHLPAERQYLELSLLQPAWLSLMVSHRLMARYQPPASHNPHI